MRERWYAVCDPFSSSKDDPDAWIWTLSKDPNETGWNTDGGFDGYGLTKADADHLAACANHIAEHGWKT